MYQTLWEYSIPWQVQAYRDKVSLHTRQNLEGSNETHVCTHKSTGCWYYDQAFSKRKVWSMTGCFKRQKIILRMPRIERGARRWQRRILPLNHMRQNLWQSLKIYSLQNAISACQVSHEIRKSKLKMSLNILLIGTCLVLVIFFVYLFHANYVLRKG